MQTNTAREPVAPPEEPPGCTPHHEKPVALPIPCRDSALNLRSHPSWNDWRWQIRNRIRSVSQLLRWFPELKNQTEELPRVIARYPMAITPYYASLIRNADWSDPIFRMSVPQMEELLDPPFLSADPLEEEADMPVPGLIHRYPDRALVMATTMCAMYCRHCTRKRVAGTRESAITAAALKQVVEYLRATPSISDVIISGGDPFTLPMDVLERILSAIRSVPSVDIIRIGTRTPVVVPQRITDELTAMLRKYHPLWINTHFNHPVELTSDAAEACAKLADAGIPLGNQTVLLKGVNDSPQIMEPLCRGLIRMRVRPYYLFQCDLVRGIEHFRTPITRGMEIMEYLRGRLSGLAIPNYVVDAPHGGGKIPLLPSYILSQSPTHTVLRNYEGMLVNYPEPGLGTKPAEGPPKKDHAPGVWDLTCGRRSAIIPSIPRRLHRRPTPTPQPEPGEPTPGAAPPSARSAKAGDPASER